jgi:hypothetical protein
VVHFANDNTPQAATVNLTVQPTDSYLTGRVLAPNGQPLPLPPGETGPVNYWASIDVWTDPDHSYNYVYLDSTGTFSMPIVAGRYEVTVWMRAGAYPDYAGPSNLLAEVGASTVNLGDLRLLQRNSRIKGHVLDKQSASGVGGTYVQAYQSGGGFEYTQTRSDGSYELRLTEGTWNVNVFPPEGAGFLDVDSAQVILPTAPTTKTLDFTLQPAAARIDGRLVDQQAPTKVLTDVSAWAYARRADSPDFVSVERVVGGGFSLNVPDGDLRVGIILAQGSEYAFPSEVTPALARSGEPSIDQSLSTAAMARLEQSAYEQAVTVPPKAVGPAAVVKSVQIALARNDAHIRGTLRDRSGAPVKGVQGVVVAAPAGANASWQWADLNSAAGTYDLGLTAGTWYLSYYLDTDRYDSSLATSIKVQVASNQIVTQDLTTVALDGKIEGHVIGTNGQVLPSTYVWARGDNFEQYVLTDEAGYFKINVPLRNGASIARYTVGTAFSCAEGALCPQLDAEPLVLNAVPQTGLSAQGIAPQDITLKAQLSGGVVTLSGKVTNNKNKAVSGAHVTFVPQSGTSGNDDTSSTGNYNMDVTFPAGKKRVRYTLYAGYFEGYTYIPVDEVSDRLTIPSSLLAATAARGPSAAPIEGPTLQLGAPVQLPQSASYLFNVADGWSYTLSDGTQIQIPANAVPVAAGETQVRIAIEPAPFLQPTSLYGLATYYGYTMTLYEASSGKQITQPLLADALLTLRYDEGVLAKHHTSEAQIRPASFSADVWQTAGKFVANTATNKVTVQTKTLGSWALVRPQIADLFYVPVVRR